MGDIPGEGVAVNIYGKSWESDQELDEDTTVNLGKRLYSR